jgi:hypothetical protein
MRNYYNHSCPLKRCHGPKTTTTFTNLQNNPKLPKTLKITKPQKQPQKMLNPINIPILTPIIKNTQKNPEPQEYP